MDLDNRWRGLLDDAIQDAVFLNSRNNELTQDNERLKLGKAINVVDKVLRRAAHLGNFFTSGLDEYLLRALCSVKHKISGSAYLIDEIRLRPIET